jgi:anti-sigma factor RsiW
VAEHDLTGLRCSEVADRAPAFVLGALEAAEADAVRRHLAGCPEAHAEMAELGSVVPALFETVELVEPPAGLKARILATAAADTQRAADTNLSADPPLVGERSRGTTRPRLVQEDRSRRWDGALFRRPIWPAIAIAAALGVVALGAWNLQLRNELSGLTAYRNGVVAVLEEAAKPGAQLAVLSAEQADGPTGLAAVAPDGRVALVMRDLAPTTGAQVYETWLIAGDAAPVAIGGFKVDASGTASFVTANANLGANVTVALTLEPGPGATTPTAPVIAAGAAQGEAS